MRTARSLLAAVVAVATLAPVAPTHAAWPNDPGVNVRIAPSAGNQWLFLSVADGVGGVFYVWNEGPIKAQHLMANGLVHPGWPAGGITVCNAATQYPSGVVADGAGGFIVAWDDYRNGSGSADVWAQRVDANGTALWTANGVPVVVATNSQNNARLCSDRAGGAILVWQDWRTFGTTNYDVYAQRLSSGGAQMWTASGVAVCTASGSQEYASVASDGTVGGAYVGWSDARGVNYDVYASRLDANGALRSGWGANGSIVCSAAGDQSQPVMAADGTFGAVVVWQDGRTNPDLYAMRLSPAGPSTAGWTSNGVAITANVYAEYQPVVVADGAGGTIVAWTDLRSGGYDIYTQRIGATGAMAWTAGGFPVCTVAGDQYFPQIAADGTGGALVGFQDQRAGYPPMIFAQHVTGAGAIAPGFVVDGNAIATAHWVQELTVCSDAAGGAFLAWQHSGSPQAGYAQHIDAWGYLGASPRIASVKDVAHDQGGRVKLSWDRSPIDAAPGNVVATYQVYRSVPTASAVAELADGSASLDEAGDVPARTSAGTRRVLTTTQLADTTVYWEYLASVAAARLAGYSYLAATAQDSVPGSNPRTLFMVRAVDGTGAKWWDSDPDSGYSTDDLAPAPPSPFAGTFAPGGSQLHWSPNAEPDVVFYRLYRGTTSSFTPGPSTFVGEPSDTLYFDAGAAPAWYKLAAVDAHGNESPVTTLLPAGTLGVGDDVPTLTAFAPPQPNPTRAGSLLRFSLAVAGPVRIEVLDAAGRRVRSLHDGPLPAGEHTLRWDGRDAAARDVAPGLYFARLEGPGITATRRIARVR